MALYINDLNLPNVYDGRMIIKIDCTGLGIVSHEGRVGSENVQVIQLVGSENVQVIPLSDYLLIPLKREEADKNEYSY